MADFQGAGEPASQQGIVNVLDSLGLKIPELLAVIAVETNGCGFLPDRRPAILFERHIFSRLTGGQFDAQAPDISNPISGGYQFGADEYPRLAKALPLDAEAAQKSASWGIGQVMGFNFAAAGYDTVDHMVQGAMASEDEQLKAMAGFLKSTGLHQALAVHDWISFARGYNGSDFAKRRYDVKLAAAYQHFSQALPDLKVRTAQMLLTYAGLKAGPIDGMPGRMTSAAVQTFRRSNGLGDSDEIDDALLDALRKSALPA
jgi:hypothetical protein